MTGGDLATRRKAAGLSQRQLAAKLGVSQQWIAALERDIYPITEPMARKLRAALGEVICPMCGGDGMIPKPQAAPDPDARQQEACRTPRPKKGLQP